MKLIYIIIDGMGDLPIEELESRTPLEMAKTPHMDFLASQGMTGLMYPVKRGFAPESDVAVISILGYDPFKYDVGRGVLEVVGADLSMNDGDLALRCNFATLGQRKEIVDRRVGRSLTTKEAKELSDAINEGVELDSHPADFTFKNTIGHRAVLVIRSKNHDLSSKITNTDPAYSRFGKLGVAKQEVEMVLEECLPMEDNEKAKLSAELVNEFSEKSHVVLEKHEINRRRVASGKLKANAVLTRDAEHMLPRFFNINREYGLNFISLTDMPVERGISKLVGMETVVLPPRSNDPVRDCKIRVKKMLDVLPSHDCFYIHIKGPDEPAHDGNFDMKTQLISIIDCYFLGELLQQISLKDHLLCVTSDHSTPCKSKAHSDDPVPVLISGDNIQPDDVHTFSEEACSKGRLGILDRGFELIPKLVGLLKA